MKNIPSEVIKARLAASFYTLDIPAEVERHTNTRLSRPDSKKQFNGACPYDDCSADSNGFIVFPELTERGYHFHCRQCKRTGDILDLIRDIKGLNFSQACRELGIPNPYKEDGDIDDVPHVSKRAPNVSERQKEELRVLHAVYPHAQLALQNERARAYLAERSIPFELAQEYGLGYIPDRAGGIDEKFSKWLDRIIFPVFTPSGEVGYCGRSLFLWAPGMDEDTHKAKLEAHNESEDGWWTSEQKVHRWEDTYPKGFFNWKVVQDFDTLVIVEGAFDVLACLAAGIPNVIPVGTTGIDASKLPPSIERVIVGLDTDAPGLKASKDLAKSMYRGGIDVTLCTPPAKDWSASYRLHGAQGLAAIQDALQGPIATPEIRTPEKSPVVQPVEESVEIVKELPVQPREESIESHIPFEAGVLGCARRLQCGGIRFSVKDSMLHVDAGFDLGLGVQRFIREHETTILNWLQSNEKPVVKETPVQPVEIKPLIEIRPYVPVSLPSLPRKVCPFVLLGWNAKRGQDKTPCKGKSLDNGFCSEHQSSHALLEIGAAHGYPEVKIPFRWKGETLWRTIHAGVEYWEDYACRLSSSRPSDTREKDVKYLERYFAELGVTK